MWRLLLRLLWSVNNSAPPPSYPTIQPMFIPGPLALFFCAQRSMLRRTAGPLDARNLNAIVPYQMIGLP